MCIACATYFSPFGEVEGRGAGGGKQRSRDVFEIISLLAFREGRKEGITSLSYLEIEAFSFTVSLFVRCFLCLCLVLVV